MYPPHNCPIVMSASNPSRRNSILVVNGLSVLGACLMSASKVTKSFELLILGRLVVGIFCGLVMSLNPLYILEVSPTNLRGAFATLNQVSYATGILVGMVRVFYSPNAPRCCDQPLCTVAVASRRRSSNKASSVCCR